MGIRFWFAHLRGNHEGALYLFDKDADGKWALSGEYVGPAPNRMLGATGVVLGDGKAFAMGNQRSNTGCPDVGGSDADDAIGVMAYCNNNRTVYTIDF